MTPTICVSLTPLDKFDSAMACEAIAAELARLNQTGDEATGEAALLGAFVYRNDDMRAKLQRVFDLAKAHDLRLDFHVDEGLDVDARGLHITYGDKHENPALIEADTIVLCAGQESLRTLQAPLEAAGVKVHLVGGALEAGELDAKRAIDQASRLAALL